MQNLIDMTKAALAEQEREVSRLRAALEALEHGTTPARVKGNDFVIRDGRSKARHSGKATKVATNGHATKPATKPRAKAEPVDEATAASWRGRDEAGADIRELSEDTGRAPLTIHKHLRAAGTEMRPRGTKKAVEAVLASTTESAA